MNLYRSFIVNRKQTTKLLTDILINDRLSDRKYYAKEVSIDYGTNKVKRVDVMEFVPKGVLHTSDIEKGHFVCYEIKSCKEDIFSGNGLNFLGEENYIVTTMETYSKLCKEGIIANGKITEFIKEHNPESSTNYGFLVTVPSKITDLRNKTAIVEEFENPTKFEGNVSDWRLYKITPCIPTGRDRSTIELLFCMLRSKHSYTNR
jgi:hypothetical protein